MNTTDPPPEPSDELLMPAQAAALIGVHPDTLSDWARSGRIPSRRTSASGHRRYRRADVDAYIASVSDDPAAASA